MTQLRRDAAYIRTDAHKHPAKPVELTEFDEDVYDLLSSAHTVVSATKALARTDKSSAAQSASKSEPEKNEPEADLESRVADAMLHLLQAERIELSPDS